ncbi:MAG: DUF1343 domain-containing protein [Sphingobacteriia bacterium]|nr:MAG: DUF1343 domain-containing protein [Sphingobacteriia bacterium]
MEAVSEGELGLEPKTLVPQSGKWAGQSCPGLVLHLTDRELYRPVFWGLLFLRCIKDMHPKDFQWQTYPTQVNPRGENHLDKLLGQAHTQDWFELPMPQFLQTISAQTRCTDWPQALLPYLLY